MLVVLRVVAGPYSGQAFEFGERDTFIVGRGSAAHFRLPKKDPYFSRTHFLIDLNPPLCRLIDLNSANGTFINGCQVEVAQLQHGDRIEAGDTSFEVTIEGEPQPEKRFPIRGKKADPSLESPALPADIALPLSRSVQSSLDDLADSPAVSFPPTLVVPPGTFDGPANFQVRSGLPDNWQKLARALPQPIPGYFLIDQLGSGGMGVVYRAVHRTDHRVVAVKMIQPAVLGSDDDYKRFRREASILKKLDHPHVVRCFDHGAAGDLLYFVMEYVPGVDAKRLVDQQSRLPVPRALPIACQMLDALAHAHRHGYVHRDVKPANLLIDSNSPREIAKLSDFGLARVYHSSQLSGLTELGTVGGTLQFMPPEQITNYREAPPGSDQYSAAATLYYLLTARHVYDFPRNLSAQLGLILNADPVPIESRRADLPAALCRAIMRGLARNVAARHSSIDEFRRALIDLF